jgi:hypothetical protein
MVDVERVKKSVLFTVTVFTIGIVIIGLALAQGRLISSITGIPLINQSGTMSFTAVISAVLTALELKLIVDISSTTVRGDHIK